MNKFELNANHLNTSRHFVNCGQIEPLPKQYFCGECGKVYKWMDNLRRHQRLECGKLPKWHCEICLKMFYRRYELTKHMKLKHHKT
ncbi:Longitudinals lacking protein, isoforms N/O/W/X/Y [Trachymyrmex septentrionalis]|uniref:Longitudinals lacking protein, isoforms N/O/W/X/Y n=1 Tax=Trachymyrmex septentrionalis TaxID=34720 RepID=A0A195EUY5_9HYME|nr:Longitudinals lacking protein, isoforms N/O/W/X/Y [Trachymyrmex septentrionalis]